VREHVLQVRQRPLQDVLSPEIVPFQPARGSSTQRKPRSRS
jgi:hypothetical protein